MRLVADVVYARGVLDLHCHLLPTVDDGATSLEAAVSMARQLAAFGFTAVAPSPHYGEGLGGDVPIELAAERRAELKERLAAEGVALELLANAEHHVTAELFLRLDAGAAVQIGGRSRWLLVELPWHSIPDPEGALFRLQAKGYRLLLAHPERYGYLELGAIERLVQRGVKMQLELGSFAGVYGGRAAHLAGELIERGLAHVAASDLHRPQDAPRWVGDGMTALARRFGDDCVARALEHNPWAIATGAAPEAVRPLVEAS